MNLKFWRLLEEMKNYDMFSYPSLSEKKLFFWLRSFITLSRLNKLSRYEKDFFTKLFLRIGEKYKYKVE